MDEISAALPTGSAAYAWPPCLTSELGEAFEDCARRVIRCRRTLVNGDPAVVVDEVEVCESAAGIDAEDGHGASLTPG